MRILQINLNHCEAAQDLLTQTVREEKVDVAIIAEPYRNVDHPAWAIDSTGKAVIWSCTRKPFQETMKVRQEGFARVKIDGVYLYSCYIPPSFTQEQYERILDYLVSDAADRSPRVVAGDFNAWAVEWGSKRTDRRGQALLETLTVLNLVLLNDGKAPTFVKGNASSIIDLTFASSGLVRGVINWRVRGDIYMHSDHQAITYSVVRKRKGARTMKRPATMGWKADSFDGEMFQANMEIADIEGNTAEHKVETVMKGVIRACNAAMPRRRGRNPHTPVHWWSEDIAELRRESNRSRRLAQRTRGKAAYQALEAKHKQARARLTKAIKTRKRRTWTELLDKVESDPWGRPYKLVMTRIKVQSWQQPTCPKILRKIVMTLFPQQQEMNNQEERYEGEEYIPPVTAEELLQACGRIGNRKAPGMDNIPNIALKTAIKTLPQQFVSMYDTCLREGHFPERWKWQRLALLPKGNKPPDDPSSYRPLCMLDTAGKILERVILNRIEVTTGGLLADNQYGFRKSRSTLDAIERVVNKAKEATAGKRWKGGSKKYCLLVALDIKNAFNTARWNVILSAIEGLQVPHYLRRMVRSYFTNRYLRYDTEDGPKEYRVTGGVPQGSVLGPLLWNIMYDRLLKMELPEGGGTRRVRR